MISSGATSERPPAPFPHLNPPDPWLFPMGNMVLSIGASLLDRIHDFTGGAADDLSDPALVVCRGVST